MKLLIVDDEDRIRQVIKEYSLAEQYEVAEAKDGEEALSLLTSRTFDVLVLDIMMKNMDGFQLLNALPEDRRIPTIILSARKEEYDKLLGFGLGIDDYLTKPFSPKELMARIKALYHRTHKETKEVLTHDALVVDTLAHTASIDGKPIKLTPKEFDLLVLFLENKNIVITREQLLSKLWGYDYFGDDRTIDTHIKMLRNSIASYREYLQTVRGVGYKWVSKNETD